MAETEQPQKTGVLTDSTGKKSAMRVMSFIALILAGWFGYITIKEDSNNGIYITTAFVVAAFAPKAVQKWAEDYSKNAPK